MYVWCINCNALEQRKYFFPSPRFIVKSSIYATSHYVFFMVIMMYDRNRFDLGIAIKCFKFYAFYPNIRNSSLDLWNIKVPIMYFHVN